MTDKDSFGELGSFGFEGSFDESFNESFKESMASAHLGARGYCVWQYGDQGWVIIKRRCRRGHHPGQPPAEKGKYKGEIKRKFCVPIAAHHMTSGAALFAGHT
jgi:hypothetical protein